jgi:hypothetical protein
VQPLSGLVSLVRRLSQIGVACLLLPGASDSVFAYEWCQALKNVRTVSPNLKYRVPPPQNNTCGDGDPGLEAVLDASWFVPLAELEGGDLISLNGVIVAGDNVLTVAKAIVYDDSESNFDAGNVKDWIKYPFGGGSNKWASWSIQVFSPDGRKFLRRLDFLGPGISPDGGCEWVDQRDYCPQTLSYSSFGIWDWDWVIDGVKYDAVRLFVNEGDEQRKYGWTGMAHDDDIGLFLVRRADTQGNAVTMTDRSQHYLRWTLTTESYNLSALTKAKEPMREMRDDWPTEKKHPQAIYEESGKKSRNRKPTPIYE